MKKRKNIWSRAAPLLKGLARGLAEWADDILLVAGGVCFVAAAAEAFGRAAALGAAGVWLTALACVIAKAKGGTGK